MVLVVLHVGFFNLPRVGKTTTSTSISITILVESCILYTTLNNLREANNLTDLERNYKDRVEH